MKFNQLKVFIIIAIISIANISLWAQSNGSGRGGGGLFFENLNKINLVPGSLGKGITIDLVGHPEYHAEMDIVSPNDQRIFDNLKEVLKSPKFRKTHRIPIPMNFLDSYRLIQERIAYWQESSPIVTRMIIENMAETNIWMITDSPLKLKPNQTDWFYVNDQINIEKVKVAVEFNVNMEPLADGRLFPHIGSYSMAALRVHESFRNKQFRHGMPDFDSGQIQKLTADFLLGKKEVIKSLDNPKYFEGELSARDFESEVFDFTRKLKFLELICSLDASEMKWSRKVLVNFQKTTCENGDFKSKGQIFLQSPFHVRFLLFEPLKSTIYLFVKRDFLRLKFSNQEAYFLNLLIDYDESYKSSDPILNSELHQEENQEILKMYLQILQITSKVN